MRSSRLLAGLLTLSLAAPLVAEESSIPDGYRTVETAIKTKIRPFTAPKTVKSALPGYFGVSVAEVKGRITIEGVAIDSPAAKAGLKAGDVVRAVDGQTIKTARAFRLALADKTADEEVAITFDAVDDKSKIDAMAEKLDALKSVAAEKVKALKAELTSLKKKFDGATVTVKLAALSRPMTGRSTGTTARGYMGIQADSVKGGLRISSVTPGSPAEKSGLKKNDVIKLFGTKKVYSTENLIALLTRTEPGDKVKLSLIRDKKDTTLTITLGTPPGTRSRGGWTRSRSRRRAWTKSVYRLGVVRIEYPDQKLNPKVTTGDWKKSLFSKGVYKDKSPTGQTVYGSMNDYYQEQSFGKLRVDGKVYDPITVKKKRTEYSSGSRYTLLREALDLILKRDGKDAFKGIDGLFFMYAGNRVRTQRGGLYWPHRASVRHDGKTYSYFICPEGGKNMANISVISHEFGHMLGMPDLYAKQGSPQEGVGVWCTMAIGHGRTGKPLHFSAWCKEQLEWVRPTMIDPTVKQKLVLRPVEDSPKEVIKVLVRPDGSEYLLLENRRKKGFDQDLPAEGLLIWRVVNGRPALEESHGYDGPNPARRYLGSVPYPSGSNHSFTPFTVPSSKAKLPGGAEVYITNIRELPDGSVAFEIGTKYF